ncbi:MAG: YbbC/YhhH family protein [Thermoanaerobaculia bacterium]
MTTAILLTVLASSTLAADSSAPASGIVPNAETAIRIAEAVWIPIYGEKLIESEKPFKATLRGDVWIVTGADLPEGSLGGVAEAHISKRDGCILRVTHGQ